MTLSFFLQILIFHFYQIFWAHYISKISRIRIYYISIYIIWRSVGRSDAPFWWSGSGSTASFEILQRERRFKCEHFIALRIIRAARIVRRRTVRSAKCPAANCPPANCPVTSEMLVMHKLLLIRTLFWSVLMLHWTWEYTWEGVSTQNNYCQDVLIRSVPYTPV